MMRKASPLMAAICSPANFMLSWKKAMRGKCRSNALTSPPHWLYKLRCAVLQGEYIPEPAEIFSLPKRDGGTRSVVRLTMPDKVVQGAANHILMSYYEDLFHENSFAFRPGRSRIDAIEKVARYHECGYSWGVRGDIERFFDTIDHILLKHLLHASIPYHDVMKLLDTLMNQPLSEGNYVFCLAQGISQGGVLSPLLSNIYLNPLDHCSSVKFPFIRYCDDFLILGRTPAEALSSFRNLSSMIAEHGLRLNSHKTSIVSFQTGFSFLGYSMNEDIYLPLSDIASLKERKELFNHCFSPCLY